ncbi:hypothetical protein CFH90_17265 [Acinetobacter johnsonii]|uniref:Uncharacterized protein n=1 Tax=Acinetobacter johnsonii TaxID=40214 RepID=A0A3Q8XFX1_ACIJO|nr:polysialyltransferase family glycosyltransferase [Acinetobacter johnsonii]AZN65672.1 hypothetical protein CFH90_17265 [Acinetobacter johnsonii]
MNKENNILIAAQTPYQFFSAILIGKKLIDTGAKVSLILVDPALERFYSSCLESNLFESVKYFQINNKEVNADGNNLSNKLKNFIKLRSIKKVINKFLIDSNFKSIVVFSDNHEIMAHLLYAGKKIINARTLMAEEGTAVFFSYKRSSLDTFKSAIRRFLGFSNYRGYSIGWSPYIDSIIVSLPELVHEDYKQDRNIYTYPDGIYPQDVINLFGRLSELGNDLLNKDSPEIFYLGQPWVESGLWNKETEQNLLSCFENSRYADKICIKPHPFENSKKYSGLKRVSLINGVLNEVPAEILFFNMKPQLVISVFSSAVINYCLRYKQKGILMVFKDSPVDLNDFIIKNFQNNKYITVVYSIDELNDVLNNSEIPEKSRVSQSLQASRDWEGTINSAVFNL